jgi:hypothetical protein
MGCGLPGRENYRPADGDTIMNNNGLGVSWRPLALPGSDTPNNNNDNGYDNVFKTLTNGMNQAQRNAMLDNGFNGLPGFTCDTDPLPVGLVDICNPPPTNTSTTTNSTFSSSSTNTSTSSSTNTSTAYKNESIVPHGWPDL